MQALLAAGADVNARDRFKKTPLHSAARFNENPEVVQALLAAGADVNARDRFKKTPLHSAARFNENPEVVQALLAAGADVNARDRFKKTPLHSAARFNENPEVVQALLAAGADVNARDEGKDTPLHDAADYSENVRVVQALLAAGADPNARGRFKKTPLDKAKQDNKRAVLEVLRSKVGPPILSAQDCRMWHTDVFFRAATVQDVKTCLAAGAKPKARDGLMGRTPLHRAARSNGNPAVIEVLLAAGADPKKRDKSKSTPLHRAAWFNENPEVVQALLAAGADVNARDEGKDTPLHDAARFNENVRVVQALLAAGADVNARNDDKDTPLHDAARFNENAEVVQALLAAGAGKDRDWTVLHAAANFNGNPAVTEMLLLAGSDPRDRDIIKSTPLHQLMQDCKLWNTGVFFRVATAPTVKACLNAGADPNARDRFKKNARHGSKGTPLQALFGWRPGSTRIRKSCKPCWRRGRTPGPGMAIKKLHWILPKRKIIWLLFEFCVIQQPSGAGSLRRRARRGKLNRDRDFLVPPSESSVAPRLRPRAGGVRRPWRREPFSRRV